MASLKVFAGRLLVIPIAIENWLAIMIGVMMLPGWFMFGMSEPEQTGPTGPFLFFLSSGMSFARRLSLTFLGLGIVVFVLRRTWVLTRTRLMDEGPLGSMQLIAALVLVLLGAVAAALVQPVLDLFRENVLLMEKMGILKCFDRGNQFSMLCLPPAMGILLVPVLAGLAVAANILGGLVSSGTLFLRLRGSARLLTVSVCLQFAFLLGLFHAFPLLEAGRQSASSLSSAHNDVALTAEMAQTLQWLGRQEAVGSAVAYRLIWLLPGFLLCVGLLQHQSNREARESDETALPPPDKPPGPGPTHAAPGRRPPDLDQRFRDVGYIIRKKVFSNPLHHRFQVHGSDNEVAFTAKTPTFWFGSRTVSIYAAGESGEQLLSIRGSALLRFPKQFSVTWSPSGQILGGFRRKGDDWLVTDESGSQIAVMRQEQAGFGSVAYRVYVGNALVCRYGVVQLANAMITADFSDDRDSIFDRRMGLALAMVLSLERIAFNQADYS